MNLYIGVMAICTAVTQVCTSSVTPALFPNQKLCQDHVAKHYQDRKVHCVEAQVTQDRTELREALGVLPTIRTPDLEEVPELKTPTNWPEIAPQKPLDSTDTVKIINLETVQ